MARFFLQFSKVLLLIIGGGLLFGGGLCSAISLVAVIGESGPNNSWLPILGIALAVTAAGGAMMFGSKRIKPGERPDTRFQPYRPEKPENPKPPQDGSGPR